MNCKKIAFILMALAPSISMAKVNVRDYGAKVDGKTDEADGTNRSSQRRQASGLGSAEGNRLPAKPR